MAQWQRCDRCRRVLSADEFDSDSTTCRLCLTVPVKTPNVRAAPVTRRQSSPRPSAAPTATRNGVRPARLGVAGSGDLEVRERRARRAAQEALVQSHPDEYALLLRDARIAEGLRPS